MEDEFGNDLTATLTEEQRSSFVCELVRGGPKTLPKLQRSERNGRLAGQWVEAKGKKPACISFGLMGLEVGVGEEDQEDNDGYISVKIDSILRATLPQLRPLEFKFRFMSGEGQSLEAQKKREELENLREDIRNKRNELDGAKVKVDNSERAVRQQLEAWQRAGKDVDKELVPPVHAEKNVREKVPYIDLDLVRKAKNRREHDASSASTSGRAPQKERLKDSCLYKAMGYVVELGEVEDEDDAKIISWAMQNRMDCLVFKKRGEDSERAYREKIRSWAVDEIPAFKQHNRVKRTEQEKREGKLPLPTIQWEIERGQIPGRPCYMVNEIQLKPEHEDLRDTVFWNALRNTVIFDTMEEATEYRDYLLREDKPLMSMYSRDGRRILQDGVRDPNQGEYKRKRVPLVFGYTPAHTDKGDVDKEVDELNELEKNVQELHKHREEKKSCEGHMKKIKELQEQERLLEQQLKDMGVGYTQTQTPLTQSSVTAMDEGESHSRRQSGAGLPQSKRARHSSPERGRG